MVATAKSREHSEQREQSQPGAPGAGRGTEQLEAEIELLRGELRLVSNRLAVEQANRAHARRRAGEADNIYVFDDDDETRDAFDAFFAAPDPHLDKVRGFLLD